MTLKEGAVVWDWNGLSAIDYEQLDSAYGIREGEELVHPTGSFEP